MRRTLLLGALLMGCASSETALREGNEGPASDDFDSGLVGPSREVRIDVLPSELLDADGDFRVLPRTVGPLTVDGDADVGTIALGLPVLIEGEVIGELVTPFASGGSLPTVVQPVSAEVTLRRSGSVQSYLATTDADGLFETLVSPDDEYDLVVVPDDPLVPFRVDRLRVGQEPPFQDLYLEYGAPIWGTVRDDQGQPLPDVEVYAVGPDGIRGASALTRDDGTYLLRVAPDLAYDVVATGRVNGRDPVITQADVLVEAYGADVDFDYLDLAPVFRSGTVTDELGAPLDGVTVRFVSKTLEGYPDGNARVVAETMTLDGNFDVRLIAGAYQLELLPPRAEDPTLDHSPMLVSDLVVEGSPDLGTIALPSFVEVSGRVFDGFGDPVGEARIACREQAFGRREWTTYAEDTGAYALALPEVPVTCTVTPPGGRRLDLASTRTSFDPALSRQQDLMLVQGNRVSGSVELDGEPEAYAVVEVRDLAGTLLGSALTEEDGYFELRVDLPQ